MNVTLLLALLLALATPAWGQAAISNPPPNPAFAYRMISASANEVITTTVAGTYYGSTGLASNWGSACAVFTDNATADRITIASLGYCGGIYHIRYYASFSGTGTHTMTAAVHLNNSPASGCIASHHIEAGGGIADLAIFCAAQLAEGDWLDVRWTCDSATGTLTLAHHALQVVKVRNL